MAKAPKGSKKQLISRVLMILVFLAGILVMAYPLYINALNGLIDQRRVSQLQENNRLENQKQKKQLEKEMKEKNAQLAKNGLIPSVDPFTDKNEKKIQSNQEIQRHLIGAVSIPTLKVTLPLFDQTNPRLLQEGATVLQGTSFPLGGANTHAVISAHSGLPEKQLFTNLEDVEKGALFVLTVMDKKLAYKIERIEVIEPTNTSAIKIEPGRDIATLMTCTPYGINSHRLLVTGHRVPYTEKVAAQEKKAQNHSRIKQFLILISLVISVGFLLFGIYRAIYLYKLKQRRFDLVLLRKDREGKPLPGIHYGLYSADGKNAVSRENIPFVRATNEQGVATFNDLPGGIYCFKESDLSFKAGIKKIKQLYPKLYTKGNITYLKTEDGKIIIQK